MEQEEYLTVNELSQRIKFAKQTIYNLIHKNVFVHGKHYEKPRPKKILFKWSKVKEWLERSSPLKEDCSIATDLPENNSTFRNCNTSKSIINI